MKHAIVFVLILLAGQLLAACNYPGGTRTPGMTIQGTATAQALALSASLTAMAQPLTPVPATAVILPETPLPGTPAVSAPLRATAVTPTATLTPVPPTETPEATREVTAVPSVTAVTDPRASLGKPTGHDTFTNARGWASYEDTHVRMQVSDQRLAMTAFNPDRWEGWTLALPALQNFYLEITARTKTCSGRDRYGLLVRSPEGNGGYLFGISCDGYYSLRTWDGSEFTTLIDWTPGAAIHSGSDQVNHPGLLARGRKLALYVNGQLLNELEDKSFSAGRYGLFIGSAVTPNFTVQVTEVIYWKLP